MIVPCVFHVAAVSAALKTLKVSPAPVATSTPDPVAHATTNLVTVTVYLVVATLFAAVVAVLIEWRRALARSREQADHADAARRQLIVFLQAYESVAAKLSQAPQDSVAPQAEALRPLFERALDLDIASAISPERRSEVYIALALAQQMIVEANVRQQTFQREIESWERERKDVDGVLRAGRAYAKTIGELELQLRDARSASQRKRLETALKSLKIKQTAHNASLAYATAADFERAEPERRRRIDDALSNIRTEAAAAQSKLQLALTALDGTAPSRAAAPRPRS